MGAARVKPDIHAMDRSPRADVSAPATCRAGPIGVDRISSGAPPPERMRGAAE